MRVLGLLDQWPQTVGLKTTETDSVTAAEAEPRIQVSAGLHPSSGGSGGGCPSCLQFLGLGLCPFSFFLGLHMASSPSLCVHVFSLYRHLPLGFRRTQITPDRTFPLAIFNSVCRDPFSK